VTGTCEGEQHSEEKSLRLGRHPPQQVQPDWGCRPDSSSQQPCILADGLLSIDLSLHQRELWSRFWQACWLDLWEYTADLQNPFLRPLMKSPDTPSCMPCQTAVMKSPDTPSCSQPAVPFPVQEVERDSMRETPFPTTHRCSVQLSLSMSGSCCICVPCKGLPVASGIKGCLQAHGQLQWMPDVAPRVAERPLHAPKVFPEHSLPDGSCHATQGTLLPLAHTIPLHCCCTAAILWRARS